MILCIFIILLSGKKIFIAPLDWGLGHATRCVALINDLKKNNEIILGITPLTKTIFEEEFPDLKKIELPAYNISYSLFFPLWMKLSAEWPRIAGVIRSEKQQLKKIIAENGIDTVISDNRFGLHAQGVRNIFITHQVFLKSPFAEAMAQKINKNYIQNFDELWIPDYEDEKISLSGELSHGKHFHSSIKYIGPMSRLGKTVSEKKFDHLFLLSGPEPQRTLFGNLLLKKTKDYPEKKFALVTPQALNNSLPASNIEIFIHPEKTSLAKIITSSQNVICRSGYSTLMDLHLLEKKDLTLVPTPGQTEQEFLARHWEKNFGAKSFAQKGLEKISFA